MIVNDKTFKSGARGLFENPSMKFQKMWTKASKLERMGRKASAQRAWVSALRHSVKSGNARSMTVALRGVNETNGFERLGPATTPSLVKSAPARENQALRFETTAGTYTLDRKQVDGFLSAVPVEIVVDSIRQQIVVEGQVIGMEGRDIPLNILTSLIKHEGGPLGMSQLFEEAWGRKYNPAYDANTVYFHICRLRKILDQATGGKEVLSKVADGYQLKPGLRFGLIARAVAPRAERTQDAVVEIVKQRGFIDNRTYCEFTSTSRSTALRELADLVKAGVLERMGQGRGARYKLAASVAVSRAA